MLQLHDLDPRQGLTDLAPGTATGVQFPLPGHHDAIAEPVLERLELDSEILVDQGGDAERLRRVDRAVQDQVGLRQAQLPAAAGIRIRFMAVHPPAKLPLVQNVRRDLSIGDGEPDDLLAGNTAVPGERVNATDGPQMRVTRPLERIRDRLPNPLRFDTPLPPLKAPAHLLRLRRLCLTREQFHIKCLRALQ